MTTEDKATAITAWALDHWVAVLVGLVAVIVSAFLVAAFTEWYKAHRNKKQEEKIEGWVIQKTLAGTSLLFAGLEYLIPLIQNNLAVLQSLKYVGGFVVAVYATANFLYAFKFKKWFKGFQSFLAARRDKLAAKQAASDAQIVQPQPQASPTDLAPDSPFEAQA